MLTKVFGLIRRRDDLSPEEFNDHYRHPHGTMGLGLGFLRGYVQSHRLFTVRKASTFIDVDAVAEIWVDSAEDVLSFRNHPTMIESIIPDELEFMNVELMQAVITREELIREYPRDNMELETGDSLWRVETRPNSVKLLQFYTSVDESDWAQEDDDFITRQLGAFRHVKCRSLPGVTAEIAPVRRIRELWWPTLSAFKRRCAGGAHIFKALLSRGDPALSILVSAEKYL